MKKIKTIISFVLTAIFLFSFTACQNQQNEGSGTDTGAKKEIYFLNFKPEIADVYNDIAKDYESETGVAVKVVTAASNTYETTLQSEIAKSDAPTIFQINGPIGYESWKTYCADISDSVIYEHLLDKSLAITDEDGKVFGIPYVVEGYGIIYNNAIMEKYFALPEKATDIDSADEINSFDKLKSVVTDMNKNLDKLGIKGVFASTSMKSGEQWRWNTHLANIPFYYEFKQKAPDTSTITSALDADEVSFDYSENFKNLYDLYTDYSITEKKLISSKSTDDSMAEFALGNVAMVQNGNWAWSQISEVKGNVVKEDDIKFMPVYTGAEGEEEQGLCIGTENYFAINSKVSDEKQQLSIDFLEWLFTSETGKKYVQNDLGFLTPFDSFSDDELPSDPLAQEVVRWMGKDVTSVEWTFTAFPSENFKTVFSDALLEYTQGTKDWNYVKDTVIKAWKDEK